MLSILLIFNLNGEEVKGVLGFWGFGVDEIEWNLFTRDKLYLWYLVDANGDFVGFRKKADIEARRVE